MVETMVSNYGWVSFETRRLSSYGSVLKAGAFRAMGRLDCNSYSPPHHRGVELVVGVELTLEALVVPPASSSAAAAAL